MTPVGRYRKLNQMHREQNFLSRSWKACWSLIEESPRKLLARWRLFQGRRAGLPLVRNTTGEGAEWQLYAIDVKTDAEKMLAPLDLPASTDGVAGVPPVFLQLT